MLSSIQDRRGKYKVIFLDLCELLVVNGLNHGASPEHEKIDYDGEDGRSRFSDIVNIFVYLQSRRTYCTPSLGILTVHNVEQASRMSSQRLIGPP